MITTPFVLVTGARTGVGRLVVDELVALGIPVRASSRRPSDVRPQPGVEVVAADLGDPATLPAAFTGVRRAFVLALEPTAEALLAAARAAGLERLVLLSSGSLLVPSSADNPITVTHREVERALTSPAGPGLVPVRPLVLATNALRWAPEIRAAGRVSLYQPEALSAPVHEADVAAVAAVALSDDGLDDADAGVGAVLTGPERLTQREQVAAIGDAVGRRLTVVELSRADAVERLRRFLPGAEAEAVTDFLDDCAAGHSPATATAARVLGRAPRDFHAWARDHADDFR